MHCGAPQTLLRSLAVTPSSSRQGSLCTNASIWYLALMNSDLMGLHGAHKRQRGSGLRGWSPSYLPGPCPRAHSPAHPCSPTHWTLSWGLALRRPLCTCAGSSRECSQMELAPLLASVCTICGEEMPSESAYCVPGTGETCPESLPLLETVPRGLLCAQHCMTPPSQVPRDVGPV